MKRRSYRVEREFGLIVGGIFVLLSAWWLYRGKFINVAYVTGSVGSLLVLLGLVFPRALVLPNRAWMALAEVLSYFSTRIILAVIYFLVLTPIGVTKRATGWDPLHRRGESAETYWRPYGIRQQNPRHYEKMF
jgi:Saxitoxin biosynthesis operon protein SxtJ